jgi:hypothetical protein
MANAQPGRVILSNFDPDALPTGGTPTRTATTGTPGAGTPTAPLTPGAGTPSPTPTATPLRADCAGDCNGDRRVRVDELVRGVAIALGSTALDACRIFDADRNGSVGVNELIAAVNASLQGCPPPEMAGPESS